MKKILFPAWLVLLAMLIPTMLHAEDIVEAEPKLSLEASLSGNDENPILTIRLTNIGEVPVIVDKELVFMLRIRFRQVGDGWGVSFIERIGDIDFPEDSELEKRLLPLKPGEKIERQVYPRKGFEQFIVGTGSPPADPDWEPEPLFCVSGNLYRMFKEFPLTEIEIEYDTSGYFGDYVAVYVQSVDITQLYRGKIFLSVTVPYEFPEETSDDAKTD